MDFATGAIYRPNGNGVVPKAEVEKKVSQENAM